MKVIPISGVIGWDVSAKEIRAALDAAAGEDVEVQIASPGGMIYDGLEIFNLIRNYKGAKTARLMGMAASMASYIAMAGDRVIAEDNAIFMIHNPWGVAVGDQNDMQKMGDILGGFAGLLAQAYARKNGKSVDAVRALMDEETYYFGSEAKDGGFVDEIVPAPAEAEKDKAAAMAMAKAKLAACRKIISEVENADSLMQVAAMLPAVKVEKPAGVAGVAATSAASHSQGVPMTIEELKKEHPDLYAAVLGAGKEAGVSQERARVQALQKWADADAENAKVVGIVKEAQATGKSEADVMPQLQVAMRNAAPAGDNPPAVSTATPANGGNAVGVDPEAIRMGAKMGVTAADIAKFGGEQKEGR